MLFNAGGFYCKRCGKLVRDDEIEKGCPYCGGDKFYEYEAEEVNEWDYGEDDEWDDE